MQHGNIVPPEFRTYKREECACFRKVADQYGKLSNMATTFPLKIPLRHVETLEDKGCVSVFSTEHLYQACRYPHLPELQQAILDAPSTIPAKRLSQAHTSKSRMDWTSVRIPIMRFCLRLKLIQNWKPFTELLISTGELPIVEDSHKDDFWGAVPQEDGSLIGANVLGRLLMELREQVKQNMFIHGVTVNPPHILMFHLNDYQIAPVMFIQEEEF
jgi:type I restriction enzyme S subunit